MKPKSIWITAVTLEEIHNRSRGSFSDFLGIAFTEIGADFLVATMAIDSSKLQPMGIMHGGVSCALAETVGSAAANFCVDSAKKTCVGLDLNINHLRAVQGGSLKAIAKPLHLGKMTQVWEIKIKNERGELVSIARLTMAVLDKR